MQYVKICSDYNFCRFRKTMLNNQCVIMHVTCVKAYALFKVAEHIFCLPIMLSWPPCSEAACVCALLLPPTWRSPLFLLAPKQLKKNFWEASSFFPTAKQPKKSPAQGMAGLIMFRSSPQCTTSTFNLIFFQPWTSLLPHPLPRSIQLYNGCHPPRRSRSDHNSAQLPGPGCLLLFLYYKYLISSFFAIPQALAALLLEMIFQDQKTRCCVCMSHSQSLFIR